MEGRNGIFSFTLYSEIKTLTPRSSLPLQTSDMTGASFIVYQILTLSPTSNSTLHTVLRRYSEFESLRKSLQRLHPTVVIPPIPEKHSLADYASKQSKTKDDPTVIAKRRRMLTSFLNRVVRHPVLGADHMVHGFLEPGSWNEVLVRTNVPKSNSSGGIAKKVLGKGSLVSPGGLLVVSELRVKSVRLISSPTDPHWTAAESYTSQFHASISHAHRTSRSIIAALESSATVSSDLAAQYNAWSLSEPPLGPALEKIGQAHEVTAKATTKLRNGLESNFAEPVQEQSQLAQAVDKVLEWRRERNVEWESVLSDIEGKRSQLAGLERTEQETARVQQGLARAPTAPQQVAAASTEDGSAFPPPSFPPAATTGGSSSTEEDTSGTHFPPTSSPPPRGPGSILSTLNSFIDNDPVATRRATISRTREKILSLTDRREQLSQDLQNSGTAIQADLDRYQREKMGELKSIMLAFAKEMRDWSRKAAQSWEEAEKEVERVEV